MISHVVLFKLLPGVSAGNEAVRAFHAAMLELPGKIPLIRGWRCGFNETEDPQAADYVLMADFDSREDMFAYFEHPDHLAVLDLLDGVAELIFGDVSA